jgi:hypothetical protein
MQRRRTGYAALQAVLSSFRRFLVVNNFLDGASSNAELLYVASPERPAAAPAASPPPLDASDIEDDGTDAEESSQPAAQPAIDGAATAGPALAAVTAVNSDASDSEEEESEDGEDGDGSQADELLTAGPGLLSPTEQPAAAPHAAGPVPSPIADLAHDETMAEATADVVQTSGD